MHILLNAIFNDLLPSVILKSELQMWFNEKKKRERNVISHVESFYFYFCKRKKECRTYFVYFHTFSYKFKVPTNFHRVWAACRLRSVSFRADRVWAPPPISRIMSPWPCPCPWSTIFLRRVTKGLIITSTSYESQNRISQTSFSLHILKKVEGKD